MCVLQECISLRRLKDKFFRNGFTRPLVILIAESATGLRDDSQDIGSSGDRNDVLQRNNAWNRSNFLESWKNACFGVAEVLTILADNSAKARESFESLIDGVSNDPSMFPLLVVLYASCESALSSDVQGLQKICSRNNIRLAVEGPGLALIGQSHRPSEPEACVRNADVMIIDPGYWFGIKMCAIVSWHNQSSENYGNPETETDSKSSRKDLWYRTEKDESHGLGTAPVINLWTVLSQIGLEGIREKIDKVTVLAETFVHILNPSPNLSISYDGVCCIVRISYALSREDRILSKEASQKLISGVNDVLFSSLEEEAMAVGVYRYTAERNTFLQFSPAQLLSCGTFWIPEASSVKSFSQLLQKTAYKYEICRAGASTFQARAARLRDLELVYNDSSKPDCALSFGGVRVVPHEIRKFWKKSPEKIATVSKLTAALAEELSTSWADLVRNKKSLQEALNQAITGDSSKAQKGLQGLISITKKKNELFEVELPFCIFLNTEMQNDIPDYVSVEPKLQCSATEAVHQAQLAGELLVAAAEVVTQSWRIAVADGQLFTTEKSPIVDDVKARLSEDEPAIENADTATDLDDLADCSVPGSVGEIFLDEGEVSQYESEEEPEIDAQTQEKLISSSSPISEFGDEEKEEKEASNISTDDLDQFEDCIDMEDVLPTNNTGDADPDSKRSIVLSDEHLKLQKGSATASGLESTQLRERNASVLDCLTGKPNRARGYVTSTDDSGNESYGDDSSEGADDSRQFMSRPNGNSESDTDDGGSSTSESDSSEDDNESRNEDETDEESSDNEDELSEIEGINKNTAQMRNKNEQGSGRRWMQWLRGPASDSSEGQMNNIASNETETENDSEPKGSSSEEQNFDTSENGDETEEYYGCPVASMAGSASETTRESGYEIVPDTRASKRINSAPSQEITKSSRSLFRLGWFGDRNVEKKKSNLEEELTSASDSEDLSHAEGDTGEESLGRASESTSALEDDGEGTLSEVSESARSLLTSETEGTTGNADETMTEIESSTGETDDSDVENDDLENEVTRKHSEASYFSWMPSWLSRSSERTSKEGRSKEDVAGKKRRVRIADPPVEWSSDEDEWRQRRQERRRRKGKGRNCESRVR